MMTRSPLTVMRHRASTLTAAAVAAFGLAAAQDADAVLLNFEFEGVAGSGSSLTAGGGVDLSGVGFTISGMTTSDTDLFSDPNSGYYAAMATFDFGASGSFTTDLLYFQSLISGDAVGIASDIVSLLGFGIFLENPPGFPSDPSGGGVALGSPNTTTPNIGDTLEFDNGTEKLILTAESFDLISVTEKRPTNPVPDAGATLGLMLLSLLGVASAKKRLAKK